VGCVLVVDDFKPAKQKIRMIKTNYQKQKQQSSTYFRVNAQDLSKITSGQYTLYDFIDNAFSFSNTKKELAINILECLKKKPSTFTELQTNLNLKKSTLYLLLISLSKSGLISFKQGVRNQPITLSSDFSQILEKNAVWWRAWMESPN